MPALYASEPRAQRHGRDDEFDLHGNHPRLLGRGRQVAPAPRSKPSDNDVPLLQRPHLDGDGAMTEPRMEPDGWCDADDLKAGMFNALSKKIRQGDLPVFTAPTIREAVERVRAEFSVERLNQANLNNLQLAHDYAYFEGARRGVTELLRELGMEP